MLRIVRDRRVLLSVVVIGGIVAVVVWPRATPVDLAVVSRGPLVMTVDEEGRTRVRDRFVVAAPVSGELLRLEIEPGDRVARGDVIARIQPQASLLLDARSRAEATAAVKAADAALGHAQAEAQRARAALGHAQREVSRSRHLTSAGATAPQELDARETEAALAAEAAHAADFAVHAASAEVERARTRLARSSSTASGEQVAVRAPADGIVLQRLRESETTIGAGEPLVAIGDSTQLEIVADLLSTDAVRVQPGARAIIEQWGGDGPLQARVRRVEPGGFTKVSALGVEEQRVNVILDLVATGAECERLGDAYRVEARIVLWESADVVKVPTSALFRDGAQWAVYVAHEGRARRALVEIGNMTATEAEVVSGLDAATRVVVHAPDVLRDGGRIVEREVR